jgi:hypothetical protein
VDHQCEIIWRKGPITYSSMLLKKLYQFSWERLRVLTKQNLDRRAGKFNKENINLLNK